MANAERAPSTAALAVAGLLSLAVAMGIGRFAFTPVLPFMMREGQLEVAGGGWIAAANYVGYLVGALTAAHMRMPVARLAAVGLVGTALLTAVMAVPNFGLWVVWRFLAGVCSAWAFVATAVWCLGALARRGATRAAGVAFAGVGAGIAVTGLYCWLAGAAGVTAASLWLQLAALALVLSLPIALLLRRHDTASAAPPAQHPGSAATLRGLVVSYGVMGFGYILPATFLPVMARAVVDDPVWFGLAWPVFGVTAALSTLVAAAWMQRQPRLQVWAVCQALMGAGALLPSLFTHGLAILASALLVGGTFMIVTLAGVQEARARAAHDPAPALARMTAAFATGQIAGPIASALLLHVPGLQARGLELALQAAALSLFATAAWLWKQSRPSSTSKEIRHVR